MSERISKALNYVCPHCGAAKGKPCTRLQPSVLNSPGSTGAARNFTPYTQRLIKTFGEPLVKPHNARFALIPDSDRTQHFRREQEFEILRRESRKRRYAERQQSDRQHQAAYEKWCWLTNWFTEYGDIFKESDV